MTAFVIKWVVVALLALNGLAAVGTIGKPRKPLAGEAAVSLIAWYAVVAILIAVFWKVSTR